MEIEVPDTPGALPKVKLDSGGLSGSEIIFHLTNVTEIVRITTLRANVLDGLGFNADGTPKVGLAQPSEMPGARAWPPPSR